MDRLALSQRLFALSSFVRLLPGRIEDACDRASRAIERLGSRVRGCKCNQDDPEACTAGDHGWCLCSCHDREITTRTVDAEMN
jgi:hypothetical protein